jgi:Spy/CpxP family protein refolding chaperone
MKTYSFQSCFAPFKGILLLLGLLFAVAPLQAQDQDDDWAIHPEIDERIRALQVGLLTQEMELTAAQAEKFFPLYQTYQNEKMELKKGIKALHKQVMRETDEAKADELMQKTFLLKEKELELEKRYYQQFKKVIAVKQIAKMHRAERKLKRLLLERMAENRVGRR